jgi:hypothetical protein
MANVVINKISSIGDHLAMVDEEESKACEQILDNILELSTANVKTETILDTAWDETFGGLFPDLEECTF